MSGICGGFEDKLNFGDIGIVETVYDWDYGKWSDEKKSTEASAQGAVGEAKFLSRPAPHTISNTRAHKAARDFVASNFNLNPELKKKIQQLSLGKVQEFGVDFVHGASGSAVVAHADIVKRITGLSDAIKVVDMECYGLYQAALTTHAARPDVLCIKAVADKANHRKDDSIHAACCELSAVAVIELISNYWDFE
jgi:nucleoside phosphorylase